MIVDLFAGPGGWDVGARSIGLDPIGVELDKDACATRSAAGLRTIRASVPDFPARPIEGLIASPPCTAFSQAGKRKGVDHLGALRDAIWASDWSVRPSPDPAVWLALEVGRFIEEATPEWVACEQVPSVLPLWEAYRERLIADGWYAWAGILTAEEYGVPQTRKRAVLVAHRSRPVGPPTPTHQRYMPRQADRGRSGLLLPWVSMADALGWDGSAGFPRRNDRDDGGEYRERDLRSAELPAFGVTEKARSWTMNTGRDWKKGGSRADAQTRAAADPAPAMDSQGGKMRWEVRTGNSTKGGTRPGGLRRDVDGPARTVDSSAGGWTVHAPSWASKRPSTTVVGSFRPDVIAAPGYRKAGDGPRQNAPGSIKVDLPDVLVLQSFPADYPVQGSRTSQFRQVGNAIPPLLAAAILEQVIDP